MLCRLLKCVSFRLTYDMICNVMIAMLAVRENVCEVMQVREEVGLCA
jgi:hypothetical protein